MEYQQISIFELQLKKSDKVELKFCVLTVIQIIFNCKELVHSAGLFFVWSSVRSQLG